MKRCRCCRQTWPLDFYPTYRMRGVTYRRARCLACRENCGAARRRAAVIRTGLWKARLRGDVESTRLARARAKGYDSLVGSGDESHRMTSDSRLAATTRGSGVTSSIEVVAR